MFETNRRRAFRIPLAAGRFPAELRALDGGANRTGYLRDLSMGGAGMYLTGTAPRTGSDWRLRLLFLAPDGGEAPQVDCRVIRLRSSTDGVLCGLYFPQLDSPHGRAARAAIWRFMVGQQVGRSPDTST